MPKLREVNGRKQGPRRERTPANTWVCGPGYAEKPRKRLQAFTCIPGGNGSTVILLPQYDVSELSEGNVETAAKAPLLRHPNHSDIVKPLRGEAIGGRILSKDGFAIALDTECAVALRRAGAKFVGFYRHDTSAPATRKEEEPRASPKTRQPALCPA